MTYEEFRKMFADLLEKEYEEMPDSYITEYTEERLALKLWEEIAPYLMESDYE